MAYTQAAIERRKCTEKNSKGKPCSAWAVWGDPRQVCVAHSERHHKGPLDNAKSKRPGYRSRTNYAACRCSAYTYPHRPGSGSCQWPNVGEDSPLQSVQSPTAASIESKHSETDMAVAPPVETPKSWLDLLNEKPAPAQPQPPTAQPVNGSIALQNQEPLQQDGNISDCAFLRGETAADERFDSVKKIVEDQEQAERLRRARLLEACPWLRQ